ncbi:retrotransposon protein, putative, ty1-copia subclass [Tanacetum coccineum]
MLQDVKSWLGKYFSMKDLGEATYILRIMITRDRSKSLIALSQSAYLDKILEIFKMENSKRGNIPIPERPNLSKAQGVSTPKVYAVRCTRLDVAFAQNLCSRFQQNPRECHWTIVKTILKYLRNTKYMVLVYKGNLGNKLRDTCYTDAGFETDKEDIKSQLGSNLYLIEEP